jgi:hypothetical protein
VNKVLKQEIVVIGKVQEERLNIEKVNRQLEEKISEIGKQCDHSVEQLSLVSNENRELKLRVSEMLNDTENGDKEEDFKEVIRKHKRPQNNKQDKPKMSETHSQTMMKDQERPTSVAATSASHLIISSSLGKGLKEERIQVSREKRVKVHVMSGARIEDMHDFLSKCDDQLNTITILGGTNNISQGDSVETILRKYDSL